MLCSWQLGQLFQPPTPSPPVEQGYASLGILKILPFTSFDPCMMRWDDANFNLHRVQCLDYLEWLPCCHSWLSQGVTNLFVKLEWIPLSFSIAHQVSLWTFFPSPAVPLYPWHVFRYYKPRWEILLLSSSDKVPSIALSLTHRPPSVSSILHPIVTLWHLLCCATLAQLY